MQAYKSLAAIIVFLLCYLLVSLFIIFIFLACIYLAYEIFTSGIGVLNFLSGAGLLCIALVNMYFIVRMFSVRHQFDESNLYPIQEEEEPILFQKIKEVAQKVGADLPAQVYLTEDVNASVYQKPNLLSIFFPTRKNLTIGMGLLSALSISEFEAVLAHEFGHFTQSGLKINNYVYSINQVIGKILEDDDEYNNLINKLASLNGFIALFILINYKFHQIIQWIMLQLYSIVNIPYLGFSRELEFEADEIASSVAGFDMARDSLLKIIISTDIFQKVLQFYGSKYSDNIRSTNIYKDQLIAFSSFSHKYKIPLASNGLPEIGMDYFTRFDKSRVLLNNLWTSHPSKEERVRRMEATGYRSTKEDFNLASSLLSDAEATQREVTDRIFDRVEYPSEVQKLSDVEFEKLYLELVKDVDFSPSYNGYYQDKDPVRIDFSEPDILSSLEEMDYKNFFSSDKVEKVYEELSISNDIRILELIDNGQLKVKRFDYEGQTYSARKAGKLIPQLRRELKEVSDKIKENDRNIYQYFKRMELQNNMESKLQKLYEDFYDSTEKNKERLILFEQISYQLQKLHADNHPNTIHQIFRLIKPLEGKIKIELMDMLKEKYGLDQLREEDIAEVEDYTSRTMGYFAEDRYVDDNLRLLFTSIEVFSFLNEQKIFTVKKNLLNYQASLMLE